MADKPAALVVLAQLRELWGKQSKGRRTIAIVALLGIASVIGYTMFIAKGEKWVEMSDGSSPDELHDLYSKLQAAGITARIAGTKIEVQDTQSDEARVLLAGTTTSRDGKGFELFDGSSLGESSFTEQVKYPRALQGELSRSIASLAQVESARVHLALGKRSVFKDREEPPTASVALHLYPNQQLAAEQVRGVRQLVAASIEGLHADQVVVVDNHGNLLEAGDPTGADRKAAIERTVTQRVRSMLERVVGAGKVSVVTTADLDESKVSETEELFDKDKQAVRSEAKTVEGANTASTTTPAASVGGIASPPGSLQGGAIAPGARVSESKTYEISRTVRQTTKGESQLVKLHLAVVVDAKAVDEKTMAGLTTIATQAAGLDKTRGDSIEIARITFAPDADVAIGAPGGAAGDVELFGFPLMYVIAAGGGVFALLVVAVMVLRAKRRRRAAKNKVFELSGPMSAQDLEKMLDAGRELPGAAIALPPGKTVQERVLDVVKNDVERAAEVITAWLQEPAPKGAK